VTLVLSSVDPYPIEALELIDRLRPIIEPEGLALVVKRVRLDKAA
jgi:hypothetical protein